MPQPPLNILMSIFIEGTETKITRHWKAHVEIDLLYIYIVDVHPQG